MQWVLEVAATWMVVLVLRPWSSGWGMWRVKAALTSLCVLAIAESWRKPGVGFEDFLIIPCICIVGALWAPELAGMIAVGAVDGVLSSGGAASESREVQSEPPAEFETAQYFLNAGKPADAVVLAERELRKEPKNPEGLLVLARAQAARRSYFVALETYDRLLAMPMRPGAREAIETERGTVARLARRGQGKPPPSPGRDKKS